MLLSVIVPTYKPKHDIVKDTKRIEKVLTKIRYNYEIILVFDGFEKIKVTGYPTNRGKGYAVRFGMARARGNIIGFIDSGMDIDPNGISMLLEHMEWYQADILIGSKYHPASQVTASATRKLLSKSSKLLIRTLFGLKVTDTQAGIKFFKRRVLEKVLPRLLVKRWAFDIELLVVAKHLGFVRIFEAPIKLSDNYLSNVGLWGQNGVWETLFDTLAVFYRLRILRYYNDNRQRQWKYDKELDMRINTGK
jgi:glycosyltransferase involved in cell wall biosynthesis